MTDRDQDLRTSFVIRQLGEIEVNGPDGLERITGLLLEGDVSSIRLASVWFGESICVVPATALDSRVAELEEARAEQWRLRREAEGSRDVCKAACDTMRIERDEARFRIASLQSELDEARGVAAQLTAARAECEGLRATDDLYVVWSHEHSCWWRANGQGYASRIEDAGVYTRDEAISISHRGRDGWRPEEQPDELPVRVADLPDFARAALGRKGTGV